MDTKLFEQSIQRILMRLSHPKYLVVNHLHLIFKETDGEVCSKIRLDRTCQSLTGKMDQEDLAKKENVILKPGSNEDIFRSSVRYNFSWR
jgi:hypothetical protein